jgi:O-succinylbenzoic acid--CoA ligase
MRDDKPFPSSLRVALIGGAKTDNALLERCRAVKVPVALTWGMSEAASQVATRTPGDAADDSGSGAPLTFARVRVNDGLLEVVGPTVGGVLTTRDRGHIDDHGRVHVDGRDDGVIVSGGEKIDPLEIETVLALHPGVRDACVLGVPSARWGERPVALVVKRTAGVGMPELDAWCTSKLSRFKTPDRYVWVDTLTTSTMDKRSRVKLHELLHTHAPELFTTLDAGPTQSVRESGGKAGAFEGVQVDERMNEASLGTNDAVRSAQAVRKGHGAVVDGLDDGFDVNALPQKNRPNEVGLGVDDRRRPRVGIEHHLDAARRHGKKLFVSLLAVLENPRKEDDSGAIDLAKADSHGMLETHEATPLKNEEDV